MKILLLVSLLFSASFAQINFAGFKDTAVVRFSGTATGVTKAMNLTEYENMRFSAMANDTSAAGFVGDSIKFRWGIQLGDVVLNSSNRADTTWQDKIVLDTFDILTTTNMTITESIIAADGSIARPTKFIDTINVTGFAVQNAEVLPPWAPVFRFWYAGITNNKNIKCVFSMSRRIASYVRM